MGPPVANLAPANPHALNPKAEQPAECICSNCTGQSIPLAVKTFFPPVETLYTLSHKETITS